MHYLRRWAVLICSLIPLASSQRIDDIGIRVSRIDREYVFTNKEAGTYHGEVQAPNSGGWQGWFVNAEKIFHDYVLTNKNETLDRTSAHSVVFPHQLIRTYADGTMESVTLLDGVDILLIEVHNPGVEISIIPTENFYRDTLSLFSFRHWKRINPSSAIVPTDIVVVQQKRKHSIVFAIAAGWNVEQIRKSAMHAANHPEEFIVKRKERMQAVLSKSTTTTNIKDLTTALAWAKLQADALIMNQSTGGSRTKGIFAGLPWFNNYWGRDSFISLPGATYVIGNFLDARDILRSYAKFQEIDTANSNFGRIPNLATPQSVTYNTADGTPWFVKSLYEYIKYSGDLEFIKEMYPVISRSIDGTMTYHCDSLGFLTHADAESWMDAVGPNGPWSPRGNRAVDIQALWYQQLSIGVFCAEYFNDFHNAARWNTMADTLEKNFRTYFVDSSAHLLFDHLNTSGLPSAELRPNQLFAFDMTIPEQVRQTMVGTVLKELVYPYGTATLTQSDSNFHPFHEYSPFYVKDAAYHNGTVWTWLNGTAVYAATRYDLQDMIFPITKNSIHQMLHRGTVGTLSELLDAYPRNQESSSSAAEPRLSGTYSQAWSLAEFIRSVYQDYFGVSVDVPSKVIRIQPKLPAEITSVQFDQRVGDGFVNISYSRTVESVTATIVPNKLNEKFGINYLWVSDNGDAIIAPVELLPDTKLTIHHTDSVLTIMNDSLVIIREKNNPRIFLRNFSDKKYFSSVTLAQPDFDRKFPVLRGPSHPMLSHSQITARNASAAIFVEETDPIGDDTGIKGMFTYPSSQHFKKGILDITKASFRYDEKNLYCSLSFSNLYDPGWHPEYGFQLTFTAIAINTGTGTQTSLGVNSAYRLDSARAYDKLILVGGGVRVLDDKGGIVCEYIPKQEDISQPLGNIWKKTIEFTVPLLYLGVPNDGWKLSILVGAQDDHGGAGIGEFRSIEKFGSEWIGGGKNDPNDSHIYDVMMIH